MRRIGDELGAWRGVARSLRVYRFDRAHAARLRALYRPLIRPGDLVFDVGAHVGDRIAAFRALGARVVAVEPQARLCRVLRAAHGRDRMVSVRRAALGAESGEADLLLNPANPTVATRSSPFVARAANSEGWEGQVWRGVERMEATTLDALIAEHGAPRFIKIDVEGFEAQVLAGLSAPTPLLSFEVVAAARDLGVEALDRAETVGYRRFRLALGESGRYASGWVSGRRMRETILALSPAANSGDVYCGL